MILPKELVVTILEFVPNIDTRRAFGIYRPICFKNKGPKKAKEEIEKCARIPIHVEYYHRFYFVRFLLPNHCTPKGRFIDGVEDDHLDFELWVGANQVEYDICIHRLKKKPVKYKGSDIYYKGNLTNYYWQNRNISYDSDSLLFTNSHL
jgi:hypothetical protein